MRRYTSLLELSSCKNKFFCRTLQEVERFLLVLRTLIVDDKRVRTVISYPETKEFNAFLAGADDAEIVQVVNTIATGASGHTGFAHGKRFGDTKIFVTVGAPAVVT